MEKKSTNVRDITFVSNNQQVDTNQGKADLLAKTFSGVSIDANYTHTFITHKADINDSAVFKSGKNIKYITEQIQKNLGNQ